MQTLTWLVAAHGAEVQGAEARKAPGHPDVIALRSTSGTRSIVRGHREDVDRCRLACDANLEVPFDSGLQKAIDRGPALTANQIEPDAVAQVLGIELRGQIDVGAVHPIRPRDELSQREAVSADRSQGAARGWPFVRRP